MTKRRNTSTSSTTSAELAAAENLQSQTEHFDNEAVERCVGAWHRDYELASINPKHEDLDNLDQDDDDEEFARQHGANAYRNAMPLPLSYEDIRDFIACTTYGMLQRIFEIDEGRELLAAAKTAMALLKAQPGPQSPSA